ncbi:MAG TPA: hypothetical protein VGM58_08470 [Verrucomicrobiae bacterium]|jgi:hypothetical protein
MAKEPPFYGPIKAITPVDSKVLYILVNSETHIQLHNAPPPFDIRTLVGDFGSTWTIKRIKGGWLLSTFNLTMIEENFWIECKAENKFADALEKYTSR